MSLSLSLLLREGERCEIDENGDKERRHSRAGKNRVDWFAGILMKNVLQHTASSSFKSVSRGSVEGNFVDLST